MRVEVYSDVVCPWCYIGERRFERALAAFPERDRVEVVYRPYQLDASAPDEAEPLSNYLERRFGRSMNSIVTRVTQAASGEGIAMDWDNALAVNTQTAHRLLGLAEREYGPEVQRTLMHELFAAHFTNGRNISDREQLTELAAAVGLDPERVRAYLASGEGAEELSDDLGRARELGIRAVPTFVFDGEYAVQGGQPVAVFVQVLEEIQRRNLAREAEQAVGACAGDACGPGE